MSGGNWDWIGVEPDIKGGKNKEIWVRGSAVGVVMVDNNFLLPMRYYSRSLEMRAEKVLGVSFAFLSLYGLMDSYRPFGGQEGGERTGKLVC